MSANPSSPKTFGRHFVVGLSSPSLSATEQRLLRELEPAGIILFAYNFEKDSPDWPKQTLELRRDVEEILGCKVIFSLDHEGGKVHRLPGPVTKFPPAEEWATTAAAVGKTMGSELHALGFNLNFAPVLDVNSQTSNPIIGARSFSADPLTVAEAGAEFITAIQRCGVAACGKHFPGHGATLTDSHLTLPVVNDPHDTLLNRDLAPFIAGFKAGLQLIMTAHVVYPALDPDYPATISKRILTDLLRQQLRFEGAIISDALEMKALDTLSRSDLAETAIAAGVDLLLLGQNRQGTPLEDALEMAEALAKKCDSSSALRELSRQALLRVTALQTFIDSLEQLTKLCSRKFSN